jgi:hypothetical protein
MSTGSFVDSIYQSNKPADNLHPIRVQPETLTLTLGGQANTAPAGPATSELRAFSSTRKRRGAVNARKVGLEITAAGPNDYLVGSTLYVPWLDPATFYDVTLEDDVTGTYNGASVRVIGSSEEKIIR